MLQFQIKSIQYYFLLLNIIILLKNVKAYTIPENCANYAKVESAGLEDGNLFKVWVNNVEISLSAGRGWNIAVFDKNDGNLLEFQIFDTYQSQSQNNIMASFLDNLEDGTPIAFGIKDESTQNANIVIYQALQKFQFSRTQNLYFRDSYAGIGIKNSNKIQDQSQNFSRRTYGKAISYGCLVFCHSKCNGCLNHKDNCLQCKSHFTRLNLAPNCQCSKGYYDDGQNQLACRLCSKQCNIDCIESASNCCDYKCGSCYGTINNCTECSHATRHNPPTCGCKPGYYESGPYKTCNSCVFPCLECTSQFQCITCNSGLNRNVAPQCDCKDGFYSNGQNDCLPCQFPCINCTDINICKSCVVRQNSNQSPFCTCKDGYFEDSNKICQKCLEICKTCSYYDQCIECSDGYFKDKEQNICIQCNYPCLNCFSNDFCTDCINSLNRNSESSNCECNQGYYDNGFVCDKCSFQCLTCKSQNECIECIQSYPQRDIHKNCNCIQGYMDDPQTGDCIIVQEDTLQENEESSETINVILVIVISIICFLIIGFIILGLSYGIYREYKKIMSKKQLQLIKNEKDIQIFQNNNNFNKQKQNQSISTNNGIQTNINDKPQIMINNISNNNLETIGNQSNNQLLTETYFGNSSKKNLDKSVLGTNINGLSVIMDNNKTNTLMVQNDTNSNIQTLNGDFSFDATPQNQNTQQSLQNNNRNNKRKQKFTLKLKK